MTTPEENYLEQPVWTIAPKTMHLDMPTVQHGALSAKSSGHIGHWMSKYREGAPPHKQNGKTQHTKRDKKHHGKKGHTDIIKMEEIDSQYDEFNIHFVGPYPDIASDPDEIMIDDINRLRKTDA